MKITRIIALAVIAITFLTGCDAIRSALGKPTSKDIAALRVQREQMKHTGDSLEAAMSVLPDTLDAGQPLAAETSAPDSASIAEIQLPASTAAGPEPEATLAEPEQEPQEEKLAEEDKTCLDPGFYVVLGSFKNPDNAKYYYNSLSASGADVHLVKMKNGFTAVMICHGATYDESYAKMQDFYRDKKKPEDIWIYNTAKKMHLE